MQFRIHDRFCILMVRGVSSTGPTLLRGVASRGVRASLGAPRSPSKLILSLMRPFLSVF